VCVFENKKGGCVADLDHIQTQEEERWSPERSVGRTCMIRQTDMIRQIYVKNK
jgi:hypothetical protein